MIPQGRQDRSEGRKVTGEPTEMAGVADAETESAYAWGALDYDDPDEFPTQRLTPQRITSLGLAMSLIVIAMAGAVALSVLRHPKPDWPPAPTPPTVVTVAQPAPTVAVALPNEPPPGSACSGAVIGHSDVKRPQLGMVRVFLFLDRSQSVYSTGRAPGCALPVTHTGRVLSAIWIDAFVGNGFGFASPATDATGNTFIEYQTATTAYGSGLTVLIPSTDGFENVIGWVQMQPNGDAYLTGVNDYYGAELIGPADGVYTIRRRPARNRCQAVALARITDHAAARQGRFVLGSLSPVVTTIPVPAADHHWPRPPPDPASPRRPTRPHRSGSGSRRSRSPRRPPRHATHNPSRLGSSRPPRQRLPHPETRLEPPPAATLRGAANPAPSPPEYLGWRRSGDAQLPRHGRSTPPKSVPPHTLCVRAPSPATTRG